ncbi:hypothetical protein Q8A67_000729 [Cirrhinus molitorella]|uniref:Uncharacterized protein n=1 Tax=Cirrhinus molitorella TaxID=172907 RepID=A0AA88QKF7_9TELE|nr:hypothetical protein Q8A67_000729 [Cirrhinus molitorella]
MMIRWSDDVGGKSRQILPDCCPRSARSRHAYTPTPQNHVGLRDCSSCGDPCPSSLCGHQGRFRQMCKGEW